MTNHLKKRKSDDAHESKRGHTIGEKGQLRIKAGDDACQTLGPDLRK